MSHPITPEGKKRLEEVLRRAFEDAGAQEHGLPQFFWSAGETMAAFKAEVTVRTLDPLTKMSRVDNWRTVDRFKVTGATENGEHTLLIYNQHQPASDLRPFKSAQRRDFCKAILNDAVRQQNEDASVIGFGFGGDANCNTVQWIAAFQESPHIRQVYGAAATMVGRRGKTGDLMIGCGVQGAGDLTFYRNTCAVDGREEQHDPMIMQWKFTPAVTKSLPTWPAKIRKSVANGAEEHVTSEAHLTRASNDGSRSRIKRMSQAFEHEKEKDSQKEKRGDANENRMPPPSEDTAVSTELWDKDFNTPVPTFDQLQAEVPQQKVDPWRADQQDSGTREQVLSTAEETDSSQDSQMPFTADTCNMRQLASGSDTDSSQGSQMLFTRDSCNFAAYERTVKPLPMSDPQGTAQTSEDEKEKDPQKEKGGDADEDRKSQASEDEKEKDPQKENKGDADEDRKSQVSADDIKCIAFALIKSLALLPSIDVTSLDTIELLNDCCSEEDIHAIIHCMDTFFLKKSERQSTASTIDAPPAQELKSADEIKAAWQGIIDRRREEQPDDSVPIWDPAQLKRLHALWLEDFIAKELTPEQRAKRRNQQTSMFASYLKTKFGGKPLVMALWQTGITWIPPSEMIATDPDGAIAYIAKQFAQWAQRVTRARELHQESPETQEAQRRSGYNTGKHGLTQEEERNRQARNKARENYWWAKSLECQIQAYEGKAKSKGSGKTKGKPLPPKAEHDMSRIERWYLEQLRSGKLKRELEQAQLKCSPVQAKDFNIHDYDVKHLALKKLNRTIETEECDDADSDIHDYDVKHLALKKLNRTIETEECDDAVWVSQPAAREDKTAHELMVMKASGHAVTNMEIEGACYAAYLKRGRELEAQRMAARSSFDLNAAIQIPQALEEVQSLPSHFEDIPIHSLQEPDEYV